MGISFKSFMAAVAAIVVGAAVWEDVRHPALELSATVRPFRYVIDTATTLAELQAKPGVHDSSRPGITLGAVLTNLQYRVQASSTLSGRHTLAIAVGYRPAVLYVANEMTRDKCSYRHVLEHEHVHVRIFEEELAGWQKELESHVASAAVQQYSSSQLEHAAERWVRDLDQRVYARHALLDSPAEYAENLKVCGGNVKRLAYGQSPLPQPRTVMLGRVTVVAAKPAPRASAVPAQVAAAAM